MLRISCDSILFQVAVFIVSVYKMFDALAAFIKDERIRSSTKSLSDVIDEWENVFAKDVNLILLKCFMKFVLSSGQYYPSFAYRSNRFCPIEFNEFGLGVGHDDCREKYLLRTLSACVNSIDFEHLHHTDKIDSKTSVDDLIDFALNNLSHNHHPVRMACYTIIRRMSPYLIEKDTQSTSDNDTTQLQHYLHKFQHALQNHSEWPQPYVDEFK